MISVFAKADALPGAEVEPAVCYGYCQTCARQHRLGVARHVVAALHGVKELRLTLRNNPIENAFHVCPHVGIGILAETESAACVLHKEVQ